MLDETEKPASNDCESNSADLDSRHRIVISAGQEGYVQGTDFESLIEIAHRADGVLRLEARPGQFVTDTDQIATLLVDGDIETEQQEQIIRQARTTVVVGARRTPRQDVVCGVLELVDVAVRSLSPGINDPFTAMNCIDRLGGAFSKLAGRRMVCSKMDDQSGSLRLIRDPVTCADAIHDGFRQIRQYGARSVAVTIRATEALMTIASNSVRNEDIEAVRLEAEALASEFLGTNPQLLDRDDFKRRYEQLCHVIDEKSAAQAVSHSQFEQQRVE